MSYYKINFFWVFIHFILHSKHNVFKLVKIVKPYMKFWSRSNIKKEGKSTYVCMYVRKYMCVCI